MALLADQVQAEKDWAQSLQGYLVAWGLPTILLIVSSYFAPEVRAVAWCGALVWTGTVCLMNARCCGRTHCRLTGPY